MYTPAFPLSKAFPALAAGSVCFLAASAFLLVRLRLCGPAVLGIFVQENFPTNVTLEPTIFDRCASCFTVLRVHGDFGFSMLHSTSSEEKLRSVQVNSATGN